jgi:hypothetical protein
MTIWYDIPGYEGLYKICKEGSIYSLGRTSKWKNVPRRPMLLQGTLKSSGYPAVKLFNAKGEKKTFLIHRLLALLFIPNPENKPFINHKNGIRNDNRIENLEWCTHQENMLHAGKVLHSLGCPGERNPYSKLSNEDVLKIKEMLSIGIPQVAIARMYNVGQSTISAIKIGQNWKFLTA